MALIRTCPCGKLVTEAMFTRRNDCPKCGRVWRGYRLNISRECERRRKQMAKNGTLPTKEVTQVPEIT